MKKKPKYSHIHPCGLCGKRYAVLNSTLHVSQSYRIHFCRGCTNILLETIRKMKNVVRMEELTRVQDES